MQFPALIPSERRYSTGEFKGARRDDLSGAMVRFLRGRVATGHRLVLPFDQATEDEARQILDHYRLCQGSFVTFELAPETWCGSSSPLDLKWRYASPPEVQDLSPGLFSVSVELISVTTSLPSRTLSPTVSSTTTSLEAQTAPVAPDDPFGTFIKCPSGIFQIEVVGGLSIPNRTIQAASGNPIQIVTGLVFIRARFLDGPVQVQIQGIGDLIVDQKNWKTVLAPILRVGLQESGTPVGVKYLEDSFEIQPGGATEILNIEDLIGMLLSPIDGAPSYLPDPSPDQFDHQAPGPGQAIAIPQLEMTVGSLLDFVSRNEMEAAAGPIDLVIEGNGDALDQTSLLTELESIEAVTSLVDLLSRDALATELPEIQASVGSNPSYIDFTSADPDEDASFNEGGIVVDGLISTIETPAVGDPDTPSRASLTAAIDLPLTVGGDPDMPQRVSASIAFAIEMSLSANPVYVDFTSGSPDEDAGFFESGIAIAFDLAFSMTVGSVIDSPRRTSIAVGLIDLTLSLATLTEPTFSDRTP